MCTRELDGAAVEFGTSGYTRDHVFVLYDRTTDSIWYPLADGALDAVAGVRKGDAIPFLDKPSPQPLSEWLETHPGSEVLLPSEADVKRLNMPYLGLMPEEGDDGLAVIGVMFEAPASRAGVRIGDVLRTLGGRPVETRRDLRAIMMEHAAGDVIEIVVVRDGAELVLSVTLEARP